MECAVSVSHCALFSLLSSLSQAIASGETIKVIQKVVDKNTYTFVDVQASALRVCTHAHACMFR